MGTTSKSSKAKAAKTTPATKFIAYSIELYRLLDDNGKPKSRPVKDPKSKYFNKDRYCFGFVGGTSPELIELFVKEFDASITPTEQGRYFVWRIAGLNDFMGNNPILVRTETDEGVRWIQDKEAELLKRQLKAEAPEVYHQMTVSDYSEKLKAIQARQQAAKALWVDDNPEKAPVEKPVKKPAAKKPRAKKVAEKPDIDQF